MNKKNKAKIKSQNEIQKQLKIKQMINKKNYK